MSNWILGALRVAMGLDTAEFNEGALDAEQRAKKLERSFEGFGKRMVGIGTKLSLAITAPLVAFGAASFKTASDAVELQSAFDQTFGPMAKDMNAWAEATGDAMGRSTMEMQKAADAFGLLFNASGKTRKEAAEMSKTFAVLAQDIASNRNLDVEDVIGKLRSGLSGEAEPLRDFGVYINEAAVKAKALEMGLKPVNGQLTDQQKLLARYNLILQGTAQMQGDVARTSDSTANRMRAMGAHFDELKKKIGDVLLPAMDPLIEGLTNLLDAFSKLPKGTQTAIVGFAAVAAAAGPLMTMFGGLTSMIGKTLPLLVRLAPVISLVGRALLTLAMNPYVLAFGAVVFGIYEAWKHWDDITAIAKRLYNGIKTWIEDKLGGVLKWVEDKVHAVGAAFEWLYDAVVGHSYVPDMVDGIARHMARLQDVMVDPAQKAATKTADAMREMAGNVESLLERLFPASAAIKQYREELQLLAQAQAKGMLGADAATSARRALDLEFLTGGSGRQGPDFSGVKPLTDGMADVSSAIEKLGAKAETVNARIVKSFKDMADETISALNNVASAVKGGGFLSILSSVLGLATQLGSIGVFGKTTADRINAPHYANGTGFHPGGLAVVGERGPEVIDLQRGARVIPNHQLSGLGGGMTTVQIIPSRYFDVVVDGKIQRAAGPIMLGATKVMQNQISRGQARRVA